MNMFAKFATLYLDGEQSGDINGVTDNKEILEEQAPNSNENVIYSVTDPRNKFLYLLLNKEKCHIVTKGNPITYKLPDDLLRPSTFRQKYNCKFIIPEIGYNILACTEPKWDESESPIEDWLQILEDENSISNGCGAICQREP